MKVTKEDLRTVAKVGLFLGPMMTWEHWWNYHKIDPVPGHEWYGAIMFLVSMLILAFVKE